MLIPVSGAAPRIAALLPQQVELAPALGHLASIYPLPLKPFAGDFAQPSAAGRVRIARDGIARDGIDTSRFQEKAAEREALEDIALADLAADLGMAVPGAPAAAPTRSRRR